MWFMKVKLEVWTQNTCLSRVEFLKTVRTHENVGTNQNENQRMKMWSKTMRTKKSRQTSAFLQALTECAEKGPEMLFPISNKIQQLSIIFKHFETKTQTHNTKRKSKYIATQYW